MALVSEVILLLFLVYPLHVLAQEKGSDLIQPGSSLYSGEHPSAWASSSGRFEFGFYQEGDGFAVGIWLVSHPENIVVWTANRDDPPVSANASLIFTREGDLLLQTETRKEALFNSSGYSEYVHSASMLDTGNFVIYGNTSIIWQSFDSPTDTLLGCQNLTTYDYLFSSVSKSNHSTGQFVLQMQYGGNLVAYINISAHDSNDAFWSTDADGYSFDKLNLNEKGSLALFDGYDESGVRVLANSTRDWNNMSVYRATLDPDGIFRIYLHQFERNTSSSTIMQIWQNLNDTCDVKGRCGLNSYCSNMDADFECYCYPGFSFIDENNKFMGCSQNFTFDGCEVRKDVVMNYNVTTLENMTWYGNSYSDMNSSKDDCKKSCQEDCSCGAALYSNGNCKKYSLPLNYGRIKENMSSTAFIKLIMGITPAPQSSPFPITDEGNKSLILIMGLSLGSVAGVCFIVAISSILIYRHRLQSYRKLLENDNSGLTEHALQFFSFSELEKATNGFRDELGRGTFGTAFKGVLPGDKGKKAIAVKKLENSVYQGEREFRTEMAVIGRTNHKNLVRLFGFCVEGSRKFLVYEYLSKGSLENFLFNSNERPTWNERVKIALDVAKGIMYLHEECEACIIHCNIKPQNILFDDSMTAKISDFGLGKLLRPNQTTINVGKRAAQYLAPEWQKNALLSVKLDVYSYGVILLELICCRNSLELQVSNADEILLSGWVYNCLVSGELNKLVVMEGEEVDMKMLERFVKVGLWCIQDDPNLRPLMKNVTLMLEGTKAVSFPPSPSLSHSPN